MKSEFNEKKQVGRPRVLSEEQRKINKRNLDKLNKRKKREREKMLKLIMNKQRVIQEREKYYESVSSFFSEENFNCYIVLTVDKEKLPYENISIRFLSVLVEGYIHKLKTMNLISKALYTFEFGNNENLHCNLFVNLSDQIKDFKNLLNNHWRHGYAHSLLPQNINELRTFIKYAFKEVDIFSKAKRDADRCTYWSFTGLKKIIK